MSKGAFDAVVREDQAVHTRVQAFDVGGIMADQGLGQVLSHRHARLLRFAVDGPEWVALTPSRGGYPVP
jgi:hypothetical protein